jgi:protein disulfide-isomerase
MRLLPFTFLFSAAALVAAGSDSDEVPTEEGTIFNSKKVPAMLELNPDNFDTEVKASKYLLLKNFRYAGIKPVQTLKLS